MSKTSKILFYIVLALSISQPIGKLVLFTWYTEWSFHSITTLPAIVLLIAFIISIIEEDFKKRTLYPIGTFSLYVFIFMMSMFIPRTPAAYMYISMNQNALNTFAHDIESYGKIQRLASNDGPYMIVNTNSYHPGGCTHTNILTIEGISKDECEKLQRTLNELKLGEFRMINNSILLGAGGSLGNSWGVAYSNSENEKFLIPITEDRNAYMKKLKGKWFIYGI